MTFHLFSDSELRSIAQGSPCAVEAWLHVNHSTEVTPTQQQQAKTELWKRDFQKNLQDQIESLKKDHNTEDPQSMPDSYALGKIRGFESVIERTTKFFFCKSRR